MQLVKVKGNVAFCVLFLVSCCTVAVVECQIKDTIFKIFKQNRLSNAVDIAKTVAKAATTPVPYRSAGFGGPQRINLLGTKPATPKPLKPLDFKIDDRFSNVLKRNKRNAAAAFLLTSTLATVALQLVQMKQQTDMAKLQHVSHEACVRRICNEVTNSITNGTNLFVVVYNLENNYNAHFEQPFSYQSFECSNTFFGVWVFVCGRFVNEGARGYGNWMYTTSNGDDYCTHTRRKGAEVHWESKDCPNPQWRETHKC